MFTQRRELSCVCMRTFLSLNNFPMGKWWRICWLMLFSSFVVILNSFCFLLCNLNDFLIVFIHSGLAHRICRCTLNSNSTVNEWTRETTKNIELCKQQIKCAMSLRSYVEIIFKQVVEDVSDRFSRTNEQFRKRMEEMRYAKMKLEGLHCGTANQV